MKGGPLVRATLFRCNCLYNREGISFRANSLILICTAI